MHIFLTGASGLRRSAVAAALIEAGHGVTGLVRRADAVAGLEAIGATALVGDVNDPATLAAGVTKADGIIHTAFNHDFSRFQANCADDVRVIETFGDLLAARRGRSWLRREPAASCHWPTASSRRRRAALRGPTRASPEQAVMNAARGVNAGVVRLPPSVHGAGDHGFVPLLIKLARDTGRAVYTGDGGNLWPAVHRLDAA